MSSRLSLLFAQLEKQFEMERSELAQMRKAVEDERRHLQRQYASSSSSPLTHEVPTDEGMEAPAPDTTSTSTSAPLAQKRPYEMTMTMMADLVPLPPIRTTNAKSFQNKPFHPPKVVKFAPNPTPAGAHRAPVHGTAPHAEASHADGDDGGNDGDDQHLRQQEPPLEVESNAGEKTEEAAVCGGEGEDRRDVETVISEVDDGSRVRSLIDE